MASVQAPLLSLGASGQVGGAIVFSTWKGRPYVRSLVRPANPKTGGQVGVRSMFKYLSQQWAAIGAANQATWEDQAEAGTFSPFNAFMKTNLERWRNFLAPGQEATLNEGYTPDVITNEAATAGERQITVSGDVANVETFNWGVCIFRQLTTPVVSAWDNCIAVVLAESDTTFTYVDSPLEPDQYYYNFRPFTRDGVLGAEETEVNATVT